MDKRIEELVEQKARELYNYLGNPHSTWDTCSARSKYRMVVRAILSHPDLALILNPQHVNWDTEPEKRKQSRLALVIPLAEALKNKD